MDAPHTLRELLERYLVENLITPLPTTERKHRVALGWFERTLGREATLADLTNANLARMMAAAAEKGCTRVTVNGYRAKIVAIWNWACKQRWVEVWSSTKKLKEPKRAPIAWSIPEIGTLWRSLDGISGYVAGVPAPLWWKCYHAIAWNTGERHSARMALRWEHFTDFDAGRGIFPAEIRKGQTGDNPFHLDAFTVDLLREMRKTGASRVLPWVFDENYFFTIYGGILRSAGLPDDAKHKTHCLRRSYATHALAAGLSRSDVSDALGQSDPSVIERYLDSRYLPKQRPSDVLFRPWELPPDDAGAGVPAPQRPDGFPPRAA